MSDIPAKTDGLGSLPRALEIGSGFVALMIAGAYVAVWFIPSIRTQVLAGLGAGGTGNISSTGLVLLALLGAIPAGFMVAALLVARRFFQEVSGGMVFNLRIASLINRFGRLCLAVAIAGPAVRAVASVLAGVLMTPPVHSLAISFSSNDLVLLILAGLMFVIGKLLAEAARIAEDNRQII
jgi:Protein of unknown function (DUF2975)